MTDVKYDKNGMNFDNLSFTYNKNGKKIINWKDSVGKIIPFNKNNICGEFFINSYDVKSEYLNITYNNKTFDIFRGHFYNGNINAIIGLKNKDYKFKIGDIVNNFEIIECLRNKKNEKSYRIKCLNCGFASGEHYRKGKLEESYSITESHLIEGRGCPCCGKKANIVVPHINSITARYLKGDESVKYLYDVILDKHFCDTHTPKSVEKVLVKCPFCNSEKFSKCNYIFNKHSIGCWCGDGFSSYEKLIYGILRQVKDDNFKFDIQYNPEWANTSYKKNFYDFLITINDKFYIIEVHGIQHKLGWSGDKIDLKKQKENDLLKKELAFNNGFNEDTYVVIWYNEDIYNIVLNLLEKNNINISKINKDKAIKFSEKNLKIEICERWNNKSIWDTTKTIADEYKLSPCTIREYLIDGNDYGWCSYDGKLETKRRNEVRASPIAMYKDNIRIKVFKSCSEAEQLSESLFGKKLISSAINKVCSKTLKHYKGFYFEYISKEDYIKYLKEDGN